MPKKPSNSVAIANPRAERGFEFTDADAGAAQQLGIIIGGSVSERLTRAVSSCNMATRLAVEAGYLLMSVKSDALHGDFEKALDGFGLSSQRASELIRMAKITTSLPDEQRLAMLSLSKTKVLALASADPQVVEEMLEDGDVDLSLMGYRELRLRIRKLSGEKVDLEVDRDKHKAEAAGLTKQLKRRSLDRSGADLPGVVADIRSELAALAKKAELSIDSFQQVGVDLMGLRGHAEGGEWVEPTARLAIAALTSLRVVIDGRIGQFCKAIDLEASPFYAAPDALAHLTPDEVVEVAKEWAELTSTHALEQQTRAKARKDEKPRGPGRPSKS